jgi:hypothetical protein
VTAVRSARLRLGGQVRGCPAMHPAEILSWLRVAIIGCVVASAVMYLWVVIQASSDIAAANRTQQAINYLHHARGAVTNAGKALGYAFAREDLTLVGTSSKFADDITQVNRDLTLAAGNNAAGTQGTRDFQYVVNELTEYQQLSETAISDYEQGPPLRTAGQGYAAEAEKDLLSVITDLTRDEEVARTAQRGAWVLDPAVFWWALLGPVIGFVAIFTATARVLARHFRRHMSPYLWGSLLAVASTAIAAALLNAGDAQDLPAAPQAGDSVTMSIVLPLLLAAAILAQLGYHPRLDEYRFRSS